MIDTHSHPYLSEEGDGGKGAIDRALDAGVSLIIMPNVDASSVEPMMRLHSERPQATAVALGLHPTEVGDGWQRVVDDMENSLRQGGFVAVGEVGIDLYWDSTRKADQMAAFERQLRLACELRLPVIIHSRDAREETLEVIEKVRPDVPLIFHSFTGSVEDVRRIREVCDPMFGINGVVTFKNARPLREALPEIGLDHLLLETDAPYLAPVPHRGKKNESAYLCHTLKMMAETLGLPEKEVEKATDWNARAIFRLP